jgi:hypothetical protein
MAAAPKLAGETPALPVRSNVRITRLLEIIGSLRREAMAAAPKLAGETPALPVRSNVRITRLLEIIGSLRREAMAAAEDGRAPGRGVSRFQVESSRNSLRSRFWMILMWPVIWGRA